MSKTSRAKPKAKQTQKAKPAAKEPAKKPNGPTPAKPVEVKVKPPATAGATQEEISAKAYEIWVAKGRPVGQDAENWAEAEAALRG